MKERSYLLNKIKSKFILQKILSMAFKDIKSVLELIKYNKSLNNKLGINIKDYYEYNSKIKIKKNKLSICMLTSHLVFEIMIFLLFLIYIIMFYAKGTFNNNNLKKDYNVKKKKFVDFMNNYILLLYFGFIMISVLLKIFYINKKEKVFLKGNIKRIYYLLMSIIHLTHYIVFIIKCVYIRKIVLEYLLPDYSFGEYKAASNSIWFYSFDIFLITFISFYLLINYMLLIVCWCENIDDIKERFLNQIDRININDFELPSNFDDLNKKAKNEFIFNKNNMKKYEYKLNQNQINLIQNINDIRQQNNIPKFIYEENEKLPDFIINKKTELIFYKNENIYKLSTNYYIFKYPKNEFKNNLNDKEIINILIIDYLDRINIIEQEDIEFVSIYKYINDINNPNNNINGPHIVINIETNIAETKDELNNNSENLCETELSYDKKSEKREVRNIRINKNVFEINNDIS